MKIPLRRAVEVTLVLAVSGGCGGERASCDWCGTVVIATAGEAGTLFPPNARTQIDNGLIDLVFQRLAEIGPQLNTIGDSGFTPALARSWSFDDPRTIRFTLNEKARWHDGVPVTAEDVAFTFDVYRDTLLSPTAMARIGRIESVTALDERTVVAQFREQYAEQFFDAVYHMRILPRHLLDSIPRERLASHPFGRRPIGSGPYRFVRWEAAQFVELAADSSFSLGRPGIPRIIWRFTPDLNTALTQLLAGEVDILEFLGGPDNIRRVAENDRLRVIMYPTLYYGYLAFNLRDPDRPERPNPLFADRRLRRAIAMGVDRK
ncbi:MAG: ABC transporter substrate-binding protein, partial [Gemmatimonadales bacterium]